MYLRKLCGLSVLQGSEERVSSRAPSGFFLLERNMRLVHTLLIHHYQLSNVNINCFSTNTGSFRVIIHFELYAVLALFPLTKQQEHDKNASKIFSDNFSWQSSNLIGDLINEQLPQEEGCCHGLIRAMRCERGLIILFSNGFTLASFQGLFSRTFGMALHEFAPLQNPSVVGSFSGKRHGISLTSGAEQLESFYLFSTCKILQPVNWLIYELC